MHTVLNFYTPLRDAFRYHSMFRTPPVGKPCKSLCRNEPLCLRTALLWGPHAINTHLNKWADKKKVHRRVSASSDVLLQTGRFVYAILTWPRRQPPPPPHPPAGMLRPYGESSSHEATNLNKQPCSLLSIPLCFSSLVRLEFVEFVQKRLTHTHTHTRWRRKHRDKR